MVSLLNEEIRVIQVSMSHVKRAISLSTDSGEKLRLEAKYKRLSEILDEKLALCDD